MSSNPEGMIKSSNFIIVSAIFCIIACPGEFLALFVLGAFYPGYNHLKDMMSSPGSSVSPVSDEISIWWVMMSKAFHTECLYLPGNHCCHYDSKK
jgi:hypothetical protein